MKSRGEILFRVTMQLLLSVRSMTQSTSEIHKDLEFLTVLRERKN